MKGFKHVLILVGLMLFCLPSHAQLTWEILLNKTGKDNNVIELKLERYGEYNFLGDPITTLYPSEKNGNKNEHWLISFNRDDKNAVVISKSGCPDAGCEITGEVDGNTIHERTHKQNGIITTPCHSHMLMTCAKLKNGKFRIKTIDYETKTYRYFIASPKRVSLEEDIIKLLLGL